MKLNKYIIAFWALGATHRSHGEQKVAVKTLLDDNSRNIVYFFAFFGNLFQPFKLFAHAWDNKFILFDLQRVVPLLMPMLAHFEKASFPLNWKNAAHKKAQ